MGEGIEGVHGQSITSIVIFQQIPFVSGSRERFWVLRVILGGYSESDGVNWIILEWL